MKPIEEQTVKALSWQMIYGNYRSKLGRQGWERLEQTVGAPNFRKMDSDEDTPMGAFNEAVLFIDHELGDGDGSMVEEITVASVDRWASIFRNLVKQLQGRPQKMMEIFCTEVHPYFLNDPGASEIVESAPDHFVLKMDNGLLEGFKTGLVDGFCDIVGAEAVIERRNGNYHVRWSVREETPEPSRWALFVNATRMPFLTATLVPVLLGTVIAWNDGFFHVGLFLLALLGALFFHLGTNVMNDYFDHTSGVDAANLTPTPFAGGSRLVQRGMIEPTSIRNLAWSFYAAGTVVGLVLLALTGPALLIFGLAGFLLGYLYTAPPFQLVHRGLGEIAVGLGFGPVVLMGAYWVQSQQMSAAALYASIPIGILIAAVLFINEIPDRMWDEKAGKRTLVTRMSSQSSILGYAILMGAAYLSILVGVGAGLMPVATLLGLFTIPLAWNAFKALRRHHAYPYRLIPANATTVFAHLFTGLLVIAGYFIAGLILGL
ncbi:MAG: 1,4-dihydroxy-2-naphthoate octaprenyltransferase [Anaerolineales bacterium]